MTGRLPLESPPTERAVLGAILRDPNLYWSEREALGPDIFVTPFHRRMIEVVHRLSDEGREIAVPAIAARLPQSADGISNEGVLATLISDDADAAIVADLISDLQDMRARRQMMALGERLMKEAVEDNDRSPVERLEKALEQASRIGDTTEDQTPIRVSLGKVFDRSERVRKQELRSGLSWGLVELDGIMGTLQPGNLIGIMADSAGGKTSLALQTARHVAKQGEPVLIFSLEMGHDEVTARLLAQESRVDEEAIAEGRYSNSQWTALCEARGRLAELPIDILDPSRATVGQIRARAMAHKRKRGLGLLVIDHLKLIHAEDQRASFVDRYEGITRSLKMMAKDLDCPVLILMQRKREALHRDNPRPRADDGFGGGGTVENLNAYLAIWREEQWLEQNPPPSGNQKKRDEWEAKMSAAAGVAEIINLKRRRGKGHGAVRLRFRGEIATFEPCNAQPGLGAGW
jgi:replicative DNA helicase